MSIHKETLDDELYGVLDSSPYSSTITQISAQSFFQEGFELSLDAIIPSIELTGSFTQFKSKTQLYIYDYSKTIIYSDKNYEGKGSYLYSPTGTSTTTQTSSIYNQFELNPTEDIYNQGYSDGRFFAVYNFIDYELGSDDKSSTEPFQDNLGVTNPPLIITNPYFIKDISGDRTELRIQNNFLTSQQIETYYNNFKNKLDARENVDEFYISFDNNENFIGINIQLELALPNSSTPTSILIKLYKPLPDKFKVDQKIQIITKVGETQVFEVEFKPNLVFIDDLFSLKGPNYNISIKDKVNNSTNFKNLEDLINTNSSESYYQFNSLQDQKGIIIRKNWGDWNEFVKYSLAEQRLRNFRDKMGLIESSSAEIASLQTITGPTTTTIDYSASINAASNNINTIIKKFDSYEYFLYYITGSESWPKYTSTYPYTNYSVTSSEANNWFGDTDEQGIYFNTGKNQIYSASRYDNDNQDNLYYLIPSFITQNISNEQYIKFVSMVGQTFDEIYLYTEAVEQIRNTNSNLTGSVLPLGMADDVIESLGFDTSGNDFSPIGFNVNGVGTFPSSYSGLEYITRYIDIASGSVINYYDQEQSTLGYIVALSDPSFPYPLENTAQEIYRRIFHNMISLVKRKGTVTGLRQLINIWGVPNTMLRISEFGGKNKNDENDYDEWINRYSTAFNSYPTPFTASNTIDTSYFGQVNATAMFPWLPLAGNYKETAATPDVAVPDCIQFRFKTARHVDGTTNISESLLLKRGQNGGTTANIWAANGDFGIYLHQSGSQSGSYSGSIDPFDNNFASMSFVISGSLTQGANSYNSGYAHCYVTSPIYLPFYNKEWWTVQLQRKTHTSASNQDATLNEFELRVGQNIYEGYDGNQIGWVASSSLTMSNAVISQSMNESWNRMYRDTTGGGIMEVHNYNDSQVYLPGNILKHPSFQQSNAVGKQASYFLPGFDLGVPMSGSFQEFRYYRRALSASAFNDFVMNPKSIQGHGNRNYGPGSSYDLLSYRVPLGNELEFIEPNGTASYIDATTWATNIRQFSFGKLVPTNANGGNSQGQSIGSVHPSAINYDASRLLYTGSFCIGAGSTPSEATDPYFLAFRFADNPNLYITSSYITANNEIIYMDQPSAGIRNRISNKIQVIDKNEYGTTLSPFRSIQQEYEQSGSYTEDINSLEVGFSFQNEINDDIIATFGHGVVSDAIADPRFTSESSDRYPELTRIAEDYFKKYQGFTINSPSYSSSHSPSQVEREYDYKRLIKFYETSLFRAIKNYIPARTSLSTGIIVKQHLLERNRAISMLGITTETPIAKTPETGSNSSGYTTQTGFNSGISNKNLEITSSIGTYSLTGSAGGSVNKYNNLIINTPNFDLSHPYLTFYASYNPLPIIPSTGTISLLNPQQFINVYTSHLNAYLEDDGFLATDAAFEGQLFFQINYNSGTTPNNINFQLVSNKRGVISTFTQAVGSGGPQTSTIYDPLFNIYPDENIKLLASVDSGTLTLQNLLAIIGKVSQAGYNTIDNLQVSSSQQINWYRDDYTGLLKVKDTQEEFYNGEYSGSNVPVKLNEYNPYRIFADGNDQTPDIIPANQPYVDFAQGSPDYLSGGIFTVNSANSISITSGYTPINYYTRFTGSFFNLKPGVAYEMGVTVTNYSNVTNPVDLLFGVANPTSLPGTYDTKLYLYSTTLNNTGTDSFFGGDSNGNFQSFASGITTGQTTFIATDFFTSGVADSPQLEFYANTANATATITVDYIKTAESLGPKHFYERDSFTIVPSQSLLFQNSPYNPLINNVSGSRKNSFLFDQDFDPTPPGNYLREGIPNDYALTVSASQLGFGGANPTNVNLLEYSEIPDSNYTAKAIITPRYEGSKMISADYNFYTGVPSESKMPAGITGLANPPYLLTQNKIQYVNGETGSWTGDTSYGKTAVIDRNPINIAHFKSSLESKEYFGTTTFNVDQLIQVPFEEILNEQSPIITSSLINGSNENLVPMSSTFMPGREATIVYNQSSKTFNNVGGTILNYTNLGIGANTINAGGIEFKAYQSNERALDVLTTTQYYNLPIWYNYKQGSLLSSQRNSVIEITPNSSSIQLTSSIYSQSNVGIVLGEQIMVDNLSQFTTGSSSTNPKDVSFLTNAPNVVMAYTGSLKDENNRDVGILNLRGPNVGNLSGMAVMTDSFGDTTYQSIRGTSLCIFNSTNNLLSLGDINPASGSSGTTWQNGIATPLPAAGIPLVYVGLGAITFPFIPSSQIIPNSKLNSTNFSLSTEWGKGSLPRLTQEEKDNNTNYFRWNISGSNLAEYRVTNNQNILIERGDEIRVSYAYQPNESDSVLNKKHQDFTVLGYHQLPPALYTNTEDISNYGGLNDVRFEIACYKINPKVSPVTPVTTTLQNPLPADGYYSFTSLLSKYNASKNNGDVFYLAGVEGDGSYSTASGSITGVSSHTVVEGTGIIGITASLFDAGDITLGRGYGFIFGTNYILNSNYDNLVDGVENDTYDNPQFLSASLSPVVYFPDTSGDTAQALDPGYLFDRVVVTPNPADLDIPIPTGRIYAMTLRKRVEADDRVILNVNQPPGSQGAQTLSGDGYLVPNDLTNIQQRNVQKIINKLKSENVFTPDSNDLQS